MKRGSQEYLKAHNQVNSIQHAYRDCLHFHIERENLWKGAEENVLRRNGWKTRQMDHYFRKFSP